MKFIEVTEDLDDHGSSTLLVNADHIYGMYRDGDFDHPQDTDVAILYIQGFKEPITTTETYNFIKEELTS